MGRWTWLIGLLMVWGAGGTLACQAESVPSPVGEVRQDADGRYWREVDSGEFAAAPVEPPAVESSDSALINHPTTGWELTKAAIDYLEPGADWVFTFNKGEPFQGVSGAIYTFTSHGFPIASARAGYGLTDPVTYGTLALDLNGLASRFIPDSIQGVSPGALNAVLAGAAKYVRVGPMAGFDWSEHKVRYGVSLGVAMSF